MDGIIRSIHRLRKYREHEARLQLAEAESQRSEVEQRLADNRQAVSRSRDEVSAGSASDVYSHHSYALRMEMARRCEEADLQARRREVQDRRSDVRRTATEARIAELVAEAREEAERLRLATKERAQLDEAGLQGWWRRTA